MHGKLEKIWIKRFHRGPMDERDRAHLAARRGIVDNADQGGTRQVTLIELERWRELGVELGIEFDPASVRIE